MRVFLAFLVLLCFCLPLCLAAPQNSLPPRKTLGQCTLPPRGEGCDCGVTGVCDCGPDCQCLSHVSLQETPRQSTLPSRVTTNGQTLLTRKADDGGPDWTWDTVRGHYYRTLPQAGVAQCSLLPQGGNGVALVSDFFGRGRGFFGRGASAGGCGGGR